MKMVHLDWRESVANYIKLAIYYKLVHIGPYAVNIFDKE